MEIITISIYIYIYIYNFNQKKKIILEKVNKKFTAYFFSKCSYSFSSPIIIVELYIYIYITIIFENKSI